MTKPGLPKRTMFAQQAVDFSQYFEMVLSGITVGGDAVRKPKLQAPEGMSTGGGKQALQHILLRPEDGRGATLTVGAVDRANGTAKLRTFEYLDAQHRARFGGQPLQVDRRQYEEFFDRTKRFLEGENFPVKIESRFERAAPQGGKTASGGSKPWLWIGLGLGAVLLLAILGAVVAFWLLRVG